MNRDCPTCHHFLPAGKQVRGGGHASFVDCCTNPAITNRHGVYATALARRWDERCGPDARHWTHPELQE